MMAKTFKSLNPRTTLLFGLAILMTLARPIAAQDTVYRVTVISDLDERSALDYKAELEGLGFLPIKLDFITNPVTVLYGEFGTQEAAIRSKENLRSAGFTPGSVVSTVRETSGSAPTSGAAGVYRVLVDEVNSESEASSLESRLEESGFLFTERNVVNGRIQVLAGQYQDPNDANNLVALLKNQGFFNAVLLEPENVPVPQTRTSNRRTARATPTPEPTPEPQNLSPVITQSSIWQELSEDQKRKVIDTVMLQDQLRSGDHVAQKIIDLERRIDDLDAKSKAVVKMIQDDREAEAQRNLEISRLYRDAQNLARGRQYDEALVKYRKILEIDPNHQLASTQIRVVEGFLRGERYDGQAEENRSKYIKLKADAESLKAEDTIEALRQARNNWVMIRALDPEKFEDEADGKINVISNRLAQLEQERAAVADARDQKNRLVVYGGGATVVVLVLVVGALSIFYVRRQRQQILSELRSITQSSVRPPRQLEGQATAGQIGSSVPLGSIAGGDAGNPGLFGDDSQAQPGDPLASQPQAQAPPPPPPPPQPQAPPEPVQAAAPPPPAPEPPKPQPAPPPQPADPGPVTMAVGMGKEGFEDSTETVDSAAMDELFAVDEKDEAPPTVDSPKTEPAAASPAPPPETGASDQDTSAFDELFSDLPSLDETGTHDKQPEPAAPPAADPEPAAPAQQSSPSFALDDVFAETSAGQDTAGAGAATGEDSAPSGKSEESNISFDDIMAAETHSGANNNAGQAGETAPAGSQQEPAPVERTPAAPADDPFADSPFADVLGGPASAKAQEASASAAPPDTAPPASTPSSGDQDIPALSTPGSGADPFDNLGGDKTATPPQAETVETPAYDPGTPKLAAGDAPTALPPTAEGPELILEQNFADDTPGSMPANWEGSYDYATLQVRSEDPPAGAKNYIAYEKAKGAGKVYYSSKFQNTSGVLNVEFDLRCNNKNKFLLGFYLEKDEDFQQSVHTKILLSETQTTPTIHIHGEPAPYLLGSWAHIRYEIDLPKGLVNGYIDGTHIAKDLRLPQAPKHLNTLAIRDNINTTGELLIANIKIEKIG